MQIIVKLTDVLGKLLHVNNYVTTNILIGNCSFFPIFSMAYAKMNKHQEAEEAYKNALRLDPDNADYQNNLSVTQQRIQEGRAFGFS